MRSATTVLAAMLVLLAASSASAQSDGASAKRPYMIGHAVENFDIAVSEVCFAYMFNGAEAGSWTKPPRWGFAPWPARNALQGLSAVMVGGSSAAIAGVGDRGSGRECTVQGDSADPQAYAAALRERLATLPFKLTPSSYQFPPNAFAERQLLCGPPEGPHVGVLMSIAPSKRQRGMPSILASFLVEQSRNERCYGVPPA